MTSRRSVIWIPEIGNDDNHDLNSKTDDQSSSSSVWLLEKTRLVLAKSHSCSLNLFVFNTLLSLESLVSSLSLSTTKTSKLSVTYSLKSIESYFTTTSSTTTASKSTAANILKTNSNRRTSLKSDYYEFKMRDGELLILDPSVYVENGDAGSGAFVPARTSDRLSKTPDRRPVYRIVSNQIEPFVIVSQLEENLQNQTDCNDGLPCLLVESLSANHFDMDFSGSFEALLNRQFMIDLIMSYRKRTNEDLKNIKPIKARAKCCTGYRYFLGISKKFLLPSKIKSNHSKILFSSWPRFRLRLELAVPKTHESRVLTNKNFRFTLKKKNFVIFLELHVP